MIYLYAMFLTAIIETICLRLVGYTRFVVLGYFFIINLVSNFCVNVVYQSICCNIPQWVEILLLESGVVVFEILCLGLITRYTKKMAISVFLTNLISFLTGVILFGI